VVDRSTGRQTSQGSPFRRTPLGWKEARRLFLRASFRYSLQLPAVIISTSPFIVVVTPPTFFVVSVPLLLGFDSKTLVFMEPKRPLSIKVFLPLLFPFFSFLLPVVPTLRPGFLSFPIALHPGVVAFAAHPCERAAESANA